MKERKREKKEREREKRKKGHLIKNQVEMLHFGVLDTQITRSVNIQYVRKFSLQTSRACSGDWVDMV